MAGADYSHIDDYFSDLEGALSAISSKAELYESIVNIPFKDIRQTTSIGLGFLAFLLVNEKTAMIDRVAISKTYTAQGAINITAKPFNDIKIPYNDTKNAIAKAIRLNKPQPTSDWNYLLGPDLSPEEARFNQAGAGIACSVVYPLMKVGVGGAIIFHYFISLDEITDPQYKFMFNYTRLVSKILNNKG